MSYLLKERDQYSGTRQRTTGEQSPQSPPILAGSIWDGAEVHASDKGLAVAIEEGRGRRKKEEEGISPNCFFGYISLCGGYLDIPR